MAGEEIEVCGTAMHIAGVGKGSGFRFPLAPRSGVVRVQGLGLKDL